MQILYKTVTWEFITVWDLQNAYSLDFSIITCGQSLLIRCFNFLLLTKVHICACHLKCTYFERAAIEVSACHDISASSDDTNK